MTQGYQKGFENINRNQAGNSAITGGGTALTTYVIGKALQGPPANMHSSIGSHTLKEGLIYGTNGAVTGFTTRTGLALPNGDNLGEALQTELKTGAWGCGMGFGGGAYTRYKQANQNNLNPWTGNANPPRQSSKDVHHFTSNKNSRYTGEMERIAKNMA